MRNDGAHLTQGLLHRIVDTFMHDQPIQDGLVHRAALPVSVAERLIAVAADHIRDHLVERFEIPRDLADGLATMSREAATSSSLPFQTDPKIAGLFVAHLDDVRRLTPTFLLRALCDGQIEIFKAGLAQRAHLSADAVGTLLEAGDRTATTNILMRAGIPSFLTAAFRAAADVIINGVPPRDGNIVSESRIREVINRIVQQYEEIDPKDLESVLMRLSQIMERHRAKVPPVGVSVQPEAHADGRMSRARAWGSYDADKGTIKFGVGNALITKRKPINGGPTRH